MRPFHFQFAIAMVAGAALGLFGGNATIAGMAPPVEGMASEPVYRTALSHGLPAAPGAATFAKANPEMARYARIAGACDHCSDYDLGFRFAAARHVSGSAQCMDFTWSYQRGCLAWLREG